METVLIIALTVFAVIALLVWWMLDIDIAGIVLLAIGAFALYFLIERRRRPPV
jgi:hypothetical protein